MIEQQKKPRKERARREKTTPERIAELRKMPYSAYLRTPEWQHFRLLVFLRAERRCQICNAVALPGHVHHRTYERVGCEHFLDVVLLCAPCHTLFHQHGRLAAIH